MRVNLDKKVADNERRTALNVNTPLPKCRHHTRSGNSSVHKYSLHLEYLLHTPCSRLSILFSFSWLHIICPRSKHRSRNYRLLHTASLASHIPAHAQPHGPFHTTALSSIPRKWYTCTRVPTISFSPKCCFERQGRLAGTCHGARVWRFRCATV